MRTALKPFAVLFLAALICVLAPGRQGHADPQSAPFTLDRQGAADAELKDLELRLSGVLPIDTNGSQSFSTPAQPEGFRSIAPPLGATAFRRVQAVWTNCAAARRG